MTKKITKLFSCLAFMAICSPTLLQAQLVVNTSATAAQMVATLVGPGITVSNITSNCGAGAWGIFSGGAATTLTIPAGIVLTTGIANNLGNPASTFNSGYPGTGSDPWLTTYGVTSSPTIATYDNCRLEFDVVPICDTIRFRYRFGCEEYPEWLNSTNTSPYSDAFAFFISGPGLPLGTNIARIPGVGSPININTVNMGNFSCPGPPTGCTNCAYYINNCSGTSNVYDGITTTLTAQAIVQACSTYHIRLSIADGSDGAWDAGVFLEQGTLTCSAVNITTSAGASVDTLIEGCQDGVLQVCHALNNTIPHTIHFNMAGTATSGVDYTAIPDSLVIPAGSNCGTITIPIINDLVPEGAEFISIAYQPNWCTAYDTVYLHLFDPVSIANAPDESTCSQVPVTIGLPSSPGWTYDWAPPFGLNDTALAQPTVNVLNNTGVIQLYAYILTATSGGCSTYDTVNVYVEPAPLANAGADVTFCEGASTVIGLNPSPSPTAVYSWSPVTNLSPSGVVSGPTVNSSNTGVTAVITQYVLTVTDAGFTCPAWDTVQVTENPTDWADITSLTPVCLDLPAFLLSNGSPAGAGGVYSGTGVSAGSFNPSTAGAGSHQMYYTFTNTFGCASTDSITIVVDPLPTVAAGTDQTICIGANASIVATGAANITTWTWSPVIFLDNSAIPNPMVLNPNPAASHPYTITVTDANGCVNTDVINIVVNPLPPVSAGADFALCIGTNANLNATGASSYVWNPTTNLSDPNVGNPTTSTLTTMTYSVTGTDVYGCVNSDDITVLINDLPVMTFDPIPPVCLDADLLILNLGSPTPGTYAGAGVSDPAFLASTAGVGSHTITYSHVDPVTGCSNSITQQALVNPLPDATFSLDPTQATLANAIINFNDLTPEATNWIWVFGDGSDSLLSIQNPDYTYTDTGTFTIYLTAINQFGCANTDSSIIEIGPDLLFFTPSAFTPNSDGRNDFFFGGAGFGFYDFNMVIFDRWGNEVFESKDHTNGWDGDNAPSGVYVYKVNMKDFDGKPFEYVGQISLLR